jgi:hypothetical protein
MLIGVIYPLVLGAFVYTNRSVAAVHTRLDKVGHGIESKFDKIGDKFDHMTEQFSSLRVELTKVFIRKEV